MVVVFLILAVVAAVKYWKKNKQTVQDHQEAEMKPMNNTNNNMEPAMTEVIVEGPISNGVAVHDI